MMAAHMYACALFEYNVFPNLLPISLSLLPTDKLSRVSDVGTEKKKAFIFVERLLCTYWYYARYSKYII